MVTGVVQRKKKNTRSCFYSIAGALKSFLHAFMVMKDRLQKKRRSSICAWLMRNLFSLHGGIELLEPHVHIRLICTVIVL